MLNIDRTFIISLPERLKDRLIPLIDYLKENELDYWVVQAIKKDNGAEGLILTIKKLLKECLDSGTDRVLILEDDVTFLVDGIRDKIKVCISQLPENFDLLYLGCNLWQTHVHKYSTNLIQLSDGYALHSVVYSRSGMQKVLDAIEGMEGVIPLDVLIKDKVMPDGNCFCSFPILTSQVVGYSNIENKVMDWRKVLQDRFTERTKHLL